MCVSDVVECIFDTCACDQCIILCISDVNECTLGTDACDKMGHDMFQILTSVHWV